MPYKSPVQTIIFGSPGTGKSYKIDKEILPALEIDRTSENCIKTVFHPEYTYGDFMGKLLPFSNKGKVEYNYYEGHFLKALAQAYKNRLKNDTDPLNVVLVIDELNRGNSSAIFGTIFQLLDRDERGWSSYEITISELEHTKLLNLMDVELKKESYNSNGKLTSAEYYFGKDQIPQETLFKLTKKIKIPPNLSIIATINTSDTSIYYMDSAFKRRWEWEFLDVQNSREDAKNRKFYYDNKTNWVDFVDKLNKFINNSYKFIRKIEDKQIGYWFIKGNTISKEQIRNKLMFFIWDSVFSNTKKPLVELLNMEEKDLVTFGDFTNQTDTFVKKIIEYKG